MWSVWESNPQPTGYESVALPIGATPAVMARTEGFEPPSMVLETTVLPLNYARIISSRNNGGEGRIRTCEPKKELIYSQPRLTTSLPPQRICTNAIRNGVTGEIRTLAPVSRSAPLARESLQPYLGTATDMERMMGIEPTEPFAPCCEFVSQLVLSRIIIHSFRLLSRYIFNKKNNFLKTHLRCSDLTHTII